MDIAAGKRLVMIGDSITDCGRARPIGEGFRNDALGKGYVAEVAATLDAAYPGQRIRVTNVGISGNRVRDLDERWQTDVLDLEPDWLSIMIGINDVWRQFDRPFIDQVMPDEYRSTLDRLLGKTVPKLDGAVVMTPFFIEPNKDDAMRKRMDEYGAICRNLAVHHGCRFVDTQAAFDRVLAHQHPTAIAPDRVHPGSNGHAVLAQAFLEAIGHRTPQG